MGLFTKTPQEKEEKILKSEQKADNKALRQALKDVERANKEELKAAKEEHGTIEVSVEASRVDVGRERACDKATMQKCETA
jgi:hypothetical protein